MCADQVSALLLDRDRTSTAGRWIRVLAGEWPVLFLWPLALAYLFPDGRLPGPRWRIPWRITLVAATGVLGLLPFAQHLSEPFDDVPSPMPVTFEGSFGLTVFWICWAGLLGGLFAGAAAVWWRKRRSTGERRLQMLWLSYGAFLVPLWLSSGWIIGLFGSDADDVGFVWLLLLYVWLAVAVGVAVTRHGLYGIERLINRTLVYGALTVALAASYGIVVLVAGVVFGGSSAVRASLATLVVALAFGPLRRRLQTLVDWRFARARYEGTRAAAGVPRRGPRRARRAGGRRHRDRRGAARPDRRGGLPPAGVGRLGRSPRAHARRGPRRRPRADPDRPRPPPGRRAAARPGRSSPEPDLLHGVLDAAAVAVEIACLRVEVRLQLEEVESSRARIVQAGVEERRRLERDLHDGAQQRLVTLGIVLRRLQRSLPPEARTLVPALDAAVDEVVAAITDLRTIAAGLRPPRLDQGLRAALADLARGAGVPVALDAAAHRAPPEVEAAAYYVACEALTNAVKHASATPGPAAHRPARRRPAPAGRRRRGRRRRGERRHGPRGAGRPRRRPGRPPGHREPARRGDPDRGGVPVRVVIAEDTVLLREGLAACSRTPATTSSGAPGTPRCCSPSSAEHEPDLAIVDVRMPPDYDDEGTQAAATIRRTHPETAVLVLSQHIETRHVVELVAAGGGFGYLLKDRVLDVDDFLDAARRVSEGGSALDPQVVSRLLSTQGAADPLAELSAARARGAVAHGRGPDERGHRQAAVADGEDRRDARPRRSS